MNLDSASRAAALWRVMAAALNAGGDAVPEWEGLPTAVKSMAVKSIGAVDQGDNTGQTLAVAFAMDGWRMGRWDAEAKTCVFVETGRAPASMAWNAGLACLAVLGDI